MLFATGESVFVMVDGVLVGVGLSAMLVVGRAVMTGERVSAKAVGGLDEVGFSTWIGWDVGLLAWTGWDVGSFAWIGCDVGSLAWIG